MDGRHNRLRFSRGAQHINKRQRANNAGIGDRYKRPFERFELLREPPWPNLTRFGARGLIASFSAPRAAARAIALALPIRPLRLHHAAIVSQHDLPRALLRLALDLAEPAVAHIVRDKFMRAGGDEFLRLLLGEGRGD